jgi:hypothetical protein
MGQSEIMKELRYELAIYSFAVLCIPQFLKGHGNELDFSIFLNKLNRQRCLKKSFLAISVINNIR